MGDYKSKEEDVKASYYGGDLAYNRDIEAIKGTIVVRSQYANQHVGHVDYAVPGDTTGRTYTFNNSANAWFGQLSYRPTMITNKFLRRLELAYRYGEIDNPQGSKWGSDKTQSAIALDYWISWNAVVKVSYEQDISKSDAGVKTKTPTRYLLQLAMGF